MKKYKAPGIVLLSLGCLTIAAAAQAAEAVSNAAANDWPQWRGPTRDGVVPSGPKLLDTWPAAGPKLLWKSEYVPAGWSSPVVGDGKVFIFIHQNHNAEDTKYGAPISSAFLAALGWAADMSPDLAKKLEDAWQSPARPNAAECPELNQLFEKNFSQLDEFLAKHAELDAYIKKFTASLDTSDAKKFGELIRKRLCTRPNTWRGGIPKKWLDKLSVLRDKEYRQGNVAWEALKVAMKGYNARTTLGEDPHPSLDSADGSIRIWSGRYGHYLTDTLVCLDAATGKQLWKKDIPDSGPMPFYAFSSTPAVRNGKVYFIGRTGLYCLSTKDGSVVWENKGGRGCHASPLIADGILFDPSSACAFNPDTGKLLWKGPDEARSNDNSPVLWFDGEKKRILSRDALLNAGDGKLLWKFPNLVNEQTPVAQGDHLLAIGGAGFKSMKITSEKPEVLWKQMWGVHGEWRVSPLLDKTLVYCCEAHEQTWICADLATGEIKWTQKGIATDMCSPVLADGKVIVPAMPGNSHTDGGCNLLMFKATGEKYIQLGKFNANVAPCTSPAIFGGKLVVRTATTETEDSGVACYDISAK